MKNKLLSMAAILVMGSTINAQYTTPPPPTFTAINPVPAAGLDDLKVYNEKAYKDFSSAYRFAQNVKMKIDSNNIYVTCISDNLKIRVAYNSNGRRLYVIRYFPAKCIPDDLAAILTESDSKDEIIDAAEIITAQGNAFLVNVYSGKVYRTIRVRANQLDVYKQYKIQ